MSPEPAIVVSDVSKTFRIYRDKNRSLKATVLTGHRARYEEFWALKDVSLEIPKARPLACWEITAPASRRC